MDKKVLIVNGGSSSLKFQAIDLKTKKLLASGIAERIHVDGVFTIKCNDQKYTFKQSLNNHKEAIKLLIEQLQKHNIIGDLKEIVGVGHRVVQCGEIYSDSVLIDSPKVMENIDKFSKLAPLHNPGELNIIKAFQELTKAQNVAVFDTSFHTTMPKTAWMYAVPQAWYKEHYVRRYGMHGTSHKYITERIAKELNRKDVNIINCHLGNGASICAVKNGKSVNTSMGLTPLQGLIMGTRSGDIDPAVVSYMAQELNKSAEEIVNILNKESGMLALSGVSSDFRDIGKASREGNKDATFALDAYVARVVSYIASYANELDGKIDAIVFTGGIGENSESMREKIVNALPLLDLKLSKTLNLQKYDDLLKISDKTSKYPLYVVRTDEEKMIFNDLLRLMK